ncbi:hypothetical protein N7448_002020 [Penicillium atrosanguineum]|uniref:Cytochrome P450 n=1 Tax=Penicillium atrosanguineum TaxID=1132637 RepID=A0A9W9U2F4_9EURO|nr:uncharacterized protein N7443_005424 [Penicillium atrosanguineum]KAJ5128302.1 hypothetical protein N7526_006468 [Penicillium atrosanguineum]KAJ5144628.1 hypothetical protein N7448_002020 [Penicillium atrosanguineum]KAJ5300422.1 hypothetical protein N7443_005424 [Penicillium atrosanguineum]KAJ5311062.1 hypothetical protein N7476_006922 [Penicillium atrosanguineum]
MALSTTLGMISAPWLLPSVLFIILACKWIYNIFFHPLARVPGPKIAACTSLWLAYHTYIGDECTVVFDLHRKYGPVLRVAPNDVDIAHGDAIEPIYLARGGFAKSPVYSKFDIDGHATIFSTLTLPERADRAKSVAPLFSTASLRQSDHVLSGVFDDFVARLRREATKGKPVNVLNVSRCMAIDAVSAYLFQQRYGALGEDSRVMSVSPFVDAYVGVGAFFNLIPGIIGDLVVRIAERLMSTEVTENAFKLMDSYTGQLVKVARPKSGSYQSRLLEKQSAIQSQIEVKDVCFAGTDSTSMNTATTMWYLAKYPEVYNRLQEEVQNATNKGEDPALCSYLRGTVREGLRLSWANPIRLPRTVPAGGWNYHQYSFPAGTSVGVASFQLHQDRTVFPEPLSFMPERWLKPTNEMLNHFFSFGKGTRACIAQNLGTLEVTSAILRVVQADLLRGSRVVGHSGIRIKEWFNSRVEGEEILIQLSPDIATS